MHTLNRSKKGSKATLVLTVLLSLAIGFSACRTAPEDIEVPETSPPTTQPGTLAIEPEMPDPDGGGAPDWGDYRDESKFDAALQARMEHLDEQGIQDTLQVLFELRDSFNEEIREHMSVHGVRLFTSEGYMVAGQGTPEALRTMTAYDYVVRVSLSHNRGVQ